MLPTLQRYATQLDQGSGKQYEFLERLTASCLDSTVVATAAPGLGPANLFLQPALLSAAVRV